MKMSQAFQPKKIKRQKQKLRNEINQEPDNMIPDTFGLDEDNNEHIKKIT